jgi:3'-phosphoadenosine 5'-phosphosulfate (PAPS) 3'-phosphatase
MTADYATELAVARAAARAAGRIAADMQSCLTRTDKADGSPVTDGDLAADRAIQGAIRATFPDDAILSEEVRDDGARCHARRLWIIDPIDGTREYAGGRRGWCVQIALAVDGRVVLGVLDQPSRARSWWGVPGQGAWLDHDGITTPLTLPATGVRDVLVTGSSSRNRAAGLAVRAALPGFAGINEHSVGIKVTRLLDGDADLYVHARFIHAWDAAAPAAVLIAAGGRATDLAGNELLMNGPDERQPGLLFTRRDDHADLARRLAEAGIRVTD